MRWGIEPFGFAQDRLRVAVERLERFEPSVESEPDMADYDVIVVGSGLAGLTAGLFAARHGLSTLVLEANIPGGHLISIEKIEDFPGFPDGIAGYDLCPTVQRQAADQGAEFQRAEVQSLEAQDRLWSVVTAENDTAPKPSSSPPDRTLKNLGVPGEEKLMGRGVSHCASCDGPLYNGQTVGVVGGGDSALQEALTLANYAERVLLFHDGETFSAQQTYQQRVLSNTKIMPRYRTVVEEILGDDVVSGVRARELANGQESPMSNSTGLFVYVGLRAEHGVLTDIYTA